MQKRAHCISNLFWLQVHYCIAFLSVTKLEPVQPLPFWDSRWGNKWFILLFSKDDFGMACWDWHLSICHISIFLAFTFLNFSFQFNISIFKFQLQFILYFGKDCLPLSVWCHKPQKWPLRKWRLSCLCPISHKGRFHFWTTGLVRVLSWTKE